MQSIGSLQTIAFLVAATVLEVSGDAIIRIALYNHVGLTAFRVALFALGAALVFGYGTFLNLAPWNSDKLWASTSPFCLLSGRPLTSRFSGRCPTPIS
jgi:hypothetical protein